MRVRVHNQIHVPAVYSKMNKSVKDMRKKSVNTLLVFGVVVAIILLMIWLFLGTTLVEDTSTEITPVPIEQTN